MSTNQSATVHLLNTNEAAEVLRLAPRTLVKWRCMGRGPRYLKVGARVVYRPADLDAFAERGACTPEGEQA